MLFGLRGSRNDAHDTSVNDPVTEQFATAIENRMRQQGKTVVFVPVQYDAIPVGAGGLVSYSSGGYDTSVISGVLPLYKHLTDYATHCPLSYEATVGYSQGQQVAREAYAMLNPGEQQHVAFMTGFGDPLFSNVQPKTNYGSYSHKLSGIYYAAEKALGVTVPDYRMPSSLVLRLQDWCRYGDPVCNYSALNLALFQLTQHMRYAGTDYIGKAARLAVLAVNNPPKR
jgi:hypothetical protein